MILYTSKNNLQKFLVEPFKEDKKYLTFLKHNIDLIGRDDLEKEKFDEILKNRYINGKNPLFCIDKLIQGKYFQKDTPKYSKK